MSCRLLPGALAGALLVGSLGAACHDGAAPAERIDAADTTPPHVTILAPTTGQAIHGSLQVVVDASDDRTVVLVEVDVDGLPLAALRQGPWVATWDPSGFPDGIYPIRVTATDEGGNSAQAMVAVMLQHVPSDQPPSVRIVTPVDGAQVCSPIDFAADATDDTAVDHVELYANGVQVASLAAPPFHVPWTGTAGGHAFRAVAYDSIGQHREAQAIVTVLAPGSACP